MSGNFIALRYRLIDEAIEKTAVHFRWFSTMALEGDIFSVLWEKLPKWVSIQLGQDAAKAISFLKQRGEALQTNL